MDRSARQRLDKWLWHARFGRTRTLAAKSIQAGNVRLNKVKITKPAHTVAVGDVLTIYTGNQIRVVRVTGLIDRRGSPEVAAALYAELTPSETSGGTPSLIGEPYAQHHGGWRTTEAHSPA